MVRILLLQKIRIRNKEEKKNPPKGEEIEPFTQPYPVL